MAIQIANPAVVEKIERLAISTGLSKTAAVERAVERLLDETQQARQKRVADIATVLAQFDQVSDRADAFDAHDWDVRGLPR